jgi:hypothetical protein
MVCESLRNGRFGEPKTGKRLIDIPDFLVKDLAGYIRRLRKQAMLGGRDVEYIFEELTQRPIQGAMKRPCFSAKLRVRSPHDLRQDLRYAAPDGALQPHVCAEAAWTSLDYHNGWHLRPLGSR